MLLSLICCRRPGNQRPPLRAPQGFSATLNAIVANIPRERQTLLFSATQTKSVKDLARLSLKVKGGRAGGAGRAGAGQWQGGTGGQGAGRARGGRCGLLHKCGLLWGRQGPSP